MDVVFTPGDPELTANRLVSDTLASIRGENQRIDAW
jgi:hypothetical protein